MKKFLACLAISSIAIFSACFSSKNIQSSPSSEYAFCIGADVSEIPAAEARGAKYFDVDGSQGDPLQIMAKHGFNTVRLRLFVNPEAPGGYSREGFCGLDSTIAFAKRIKAAGMAFALNFHYSDTWADPDHQIKPSAWKNADGKELTGKALETRLYEYTRDTLLAFKNAGAAPEIIQIGNEISHGFVWPDGKLMDTAVEADWANCMNLYKAGQKAAREILPDAKLQVHLALGGENILCHNFLDHMLMYKAEFDIIGLSYYEKWHETYDDMMANIHDLAKSYGKPVNICEYGANLDNTRKIADIVRSIPNAMGHGTMAWAPSGTLFPRYRADSKLFAVYEQMKKDFTSPLPDSLCKPPAPRNVSFQKPIIGADLSWVPSQEAHGTKFSDNGVQKDVLEIMKDHHFNWVRLRLFVDPTAQNGYSREGFCGLDSTIAFAKRIKAAGMNLQLDLHYSDNWADPEKQVIPASWKQHYGSGLEGHLYSYTYDIVKRFIKEGARPDMIQTGNEINNGMVWPQGKVDTEKDSYESFAVMLRCATAGVRAADPTIPVMIHIASGGNNFKCVHFFDKIISRDVKFDVIGLSYYPKYHGTPQQLEFNVNNLAKRYGKPIVCVEYQQYRKEVNEIMHNIPDGLGGGAFIWEATSPMWGNLFDNSGKTNKNIIDYDEFWSSIKK